MLHASYAVTQKKDKSRQKVLVLRAKHFGKSYTRARFPYLLNTHSLHHVAHFMTGYMPYSEAASSAWFVRQMKP